MGAKSQRKMLAPARSRREREYIVAIGLGVSPSYAEEHELCGVDIENATPSATVAGSIKTIGWLVSARWGNGVLTLESGEQLKFHLVGAKALETGAAENDFEGEVYNLKNAGDFEGTYWGVSRNINLGTLGKGTPSPASTVLPAGSGGGVMQTTLHDSRSFWPDLAPWLDCCDRVSA